jgi:hypothetical protein
VASARSARPTASSVKLRFSKPLFLLLFNGDEHQVSDAAMPLEICLPPDFTWRFQ